MIKSILAALLLSIVSCNEETGTNTPVTKLAATAKDTVIVKHKNQLKPYEVWSVSKSYSYYWLVEDDTLDFAVDVTQYKNDSAIHVSILHNRPMLFKDALIRINESIHIIKKDFDPGKLRSLGFNVPIFYFDLVTELSKQYAQQFGQKTISDQQLNQFLLKASVSTQLNTFLQPLNKKVASYGIEKFGLSTKEYYSFDFPEIDTTGYPDLVIHGLGFSVRVTDKK